LQEKRVFESNKRKVLDFLKNRELPAAARFYVENAAERQFGIGPMVIIADATGKPYTVPSDLPRELRVAVEREMEVARALAVTFGPAMAIRKLVGITGAVQELNEQFALALSGDDLPETGLARAIHNRVCELTQSANYPA
jgi:hypothetical protein